MLVAVAMAAADRHRCRDDEHKDAHKDEHDDGHDGDDDAHFEKSDDGDRMRWQLYNDGGGVYTT